jgi:transposase-like protein
MQEFKEEAVSLFLDGVLTVAAVGRYQKTSKQMLRNWTKKHHGCGSKNSACHPVTGLGAEVPKLREELAGARLEKEFEKNRSEDGEFYFALKNAVAYLANEPRGGMR